jgi:hypothetical protein
MCKGAILTIFTLMDMFGKLCAKLSFVLFYMIETLHPVVSQCTTVLTLAFVGFRIVTELRRVILVLTSLVLY